MTRQSIINRTVYALNQLPDEKAQEVFDFVEFLLKKYEDLIITRELQKLSAHGQTFDFLYEEEDLYSESDLKEVYNG